jgi:hypothetical protein
MANEELKAHFKDIKKSGDKMLDASTKWALAADTLWWAPLPSDALGRAGSEVGLISQYTQLCREVNTELREGSQTLGMAAAALWSVSKAYENAEHQARDKVLRVRGFDPATVPKGYW